MRIGIDLGGTKIEGIALDGSARWREFAIDTPRATINQATSSHPPQIVADSNAAAGARGTSGVGIPGTL
jgi:fructokinase